jgi:hypothetical protein
MCEYLYKGGYAMLSVVSLTFWHLGSCLRSQYPSRGWIMICLNGGISTAEYRPLSDYGFRGIWENMGRNPVPYRGETGIETWEQAS